MFTGKKIAAHRINITSTPVKSLLLLVSQPNITVFDTDLLLVLLLSVTICICIRTIAIINIIYIYKCSIYTMNHECNYNHRFLYFYLLKLLLYWFDNYGQSNIQYGIKLLYQNYISRNSPTCISRSKRW